MQGSRVTRIRIEELIIRSNFPLKTSPFIEIPKKQDQHSNRVHRLKQKVQCKKWSNHERAIRINNRAEIFTNTGSRHGSRTPAWKLKFLLLPAYRVRRLLTVRNCLARWLRPWPGLVNAANFSLSRLLLSLWGGCRGRLAWRKLLAGCNKRRGTKLISGGGGLIERKFCGRFGDNYAFATRWKFLWKEPLDF